MHRRTWVQLLIPSLGILLVACGSAPERQPASHASESTANTKVSPAVGEPARLFAFDADQAGNPPGGFTFGRTGNGQPGKWAVRAEGDAPSAPNVLAQLDADDTNYRFPCAVADGVSLADLRLSARCKLISGTVDQACGLVFRYRDENNY